MTTETEAINVLASVANDLVTALQPLKHLLNLDNLDAIAANLQIITDILQRLENTISHVGVPGIQRALQDIATELAQNAPDLPSAYDDDASPNFHRALTEYPAFDWSTIGANVVRADNHGATIVTWRTLEWERRAHASFDNAIWFSRYTGKEDDNGAKIYSRLVTFHPRRPVRSLPDEITDELPDPLPVATLDPDAADLDKVFPANYSRR